MEISEHNADRPFEAKMAEIDNSLRNLCEEMRVLGASLRANERVVIDALLKFEAIQARRQELMAGFSMLRADVRRTS